MRPRSSHAYARRTWFGARRKHVWVGVGPEYGLHSIKIDRVRSFDTRRSAPRRRSIADLRAIAPFSARAACNGAAFLHFPHARFVRRATASGGTACSPLGLDHHEGRRRRSRAARAPPGRRRNSNELAFVARMNIARSLRGRWPPARREGSRRALLARRRGYRARRPAHGVGCGQRGPHGIARTPSPVMQPGNPRGSLVAHNGATCASARRTGRGALKGQRRGCAPGRLHPGDGWCTSSRGNGLGAVLRPRGRFGGGIRVLAFARRAPPRPRFWSTLRHAGEGCITRAARAAYSCRPKVAGRPRELVRTFVLRGEGACRCNLDRRAAIGARTLR